MALVVEDGTGKVDAESYNSVAELVTYFTANGEPTGWAALSTGDREKFARISTRWMDPRWTWSGLLAHPETPQALAFPREQLYDSEGRAYSATAVPVRIKTLHAEVVRMAVEGKLQLSSLARGGGVQSQSAGPVSQSFFQSASLKTTYPYLDSIARPLTSLGGGLVVLRA